jgi:polyhydroxyalkanoate synthesis regulator phasin
MQDAWRAYLELAYGLTEASRKKAREVARDLLGRGEATAGQVQAFVDDLVSTSRSNREGLVRLVRYEVDRALGAVGLATVDQVAELTARMQDLERRLTAETGPAAAGTGAAAAAAAATATAAKPPVAKKAVVKKAVAKKAVAKKAVAKKAVPTRTGAFAETPKRAAPGGATPRTTGRKAAG